MASLPDKIKAIKHGLKAAAATFIDQPAQFTAADLLIKCPHCEGTYFNESRILMNTSGMSFLGLDWLNSESTALKCAKCSRIQWFADELQPIDTDA